MNVFKEMALSVYSYGSYRHFLKNKTGKVFGFGVLLMTFYFAVTMILPQIIGHGSILRLEENIREAVPDFELEDGILWVDDVVELDNGVSYIYVNTSRNYSADVTEAAFAFQRYNSVIIMDAKKAVMKSDGKWQTLYYSDMDVEFDREDLMDFVPWLYVFDAVFLLFAYIWMTAFFFFGVLFVALIGMIIASSMNFRLTFGQLYLLGVYSRTLPLLIKALVSFLPFGVPFFWVLNFGLSAFILAMAIKKMKSGS